MHFNFIQIWIENIYQVITMQVQSVNAKMNAVIIIKGNNAKENKEENEHEKEKDEETLNLVNSETNEIITNGFGAKKSASESKDNLW